jgi:Reverse transcriptase (RNA-dependent DNA polymerase)
MPTIPAYTVSDFISDDSPRGLFPLESQMLYPKHGSVEMSAYIKNGIFDSDDPTRAFLAAPICYALKDARHLRKVLGLDPLATYFLYEFVHKHARDHFQSCKPGNRRRFGYAFKNRRPLSPSEQYHEFRRDTYRLRVEFPYYARVDIGNCFNSFYHHDVQQFVEEKISDEAGAEIGQFLREINSGTSVNCFPQGIYPAKALGNLYLTFIEENVRLKSSGIIRFLDDICLFDENQQTIFDDIYRLQEILGLHNLSLNAQKTDIGSLREHQRLKAVDVIKKRLLAKREERRSYDDSTEGAEELDESEKVYLEDLLSQQVVPEEDLELAITFVDDNDTVMRVLELVCDQHPHLIKHVHRLFGLVSFDDNGDSWDLLQKKVYSANTTEYGLFWLSKLIADYYNFDEVAAEALTHIHSHKNASPFVKASVLENPNNKLGFLELKEDQLRNSSGDIVGCAALMGLRNAKASKRNQLGKYAARSGPHMKLYADIVSKM